MTETRQFEDYQSRLNQDFYIEVEAGNWVPAKLVEASEHKFTYDHGGETPRASFSIVFLLESDVQLPQKTFNIKHDELGENQIFLVPLQPDVKGTRYEAVFT